MLRVAELVPHKVTSKNYDYLDSVLQGKYVENYINKKKQEEMDKNLKFLVSR